VFREVRPESAFNISGVEQDIESQSLVVPPRVERFKKLHQRLWLIERLATADGDAIKGTARYIATPAYKRGDVHTTVAVELPHIEGAARAAMDGATLEPDAYPFPVSEH
jgi:hypothetical protein